MHDRVRAAKAFEGADGIEHAAQRVVDLMGNAGGEPPDSGHAFAFDHFFFKLCLFHQLGAHVGIGCKQLAHFVLVGVERGVECLEFVTADAADALGDQFHGLHHAPPPVGGDGQQHAQHQQGDPQGVAQQVGETLPQQGFVVGHHQGAQPHPIVDDGQGHVNVLCLPDVQHKHIGIRGPREGPVQFGQLAAQRRQRA